MGELMCQDIGQGDLVIRPTSSLRWFDTLLAGWIVLVAALYFAQFLPYLSVGLAIARRVLALQ